MKPPQAFHDFTLQFHQDLELAHPGWASEEPLARYEIYEGFRQGYGDRAINELVVYFRCVLNDKDADLESLWFKESKADWVISEEGLRRLFKDFETWASSLR